jgi:hypothetical protein
MIFKQQADRKLVLSIGYWLRMKPLRTAVSSPVYRERLRKGSQKSIASGFGKEAKKKHERPRSRMSRSAVGAHVLAGQHSSSWICRRPVSLSPK